ncbi:MAG: sterol desaturase family protein [Hyphomonadaceae bacterium]|nr:sterol desaturase family protein [Hyphomonadaceae bacterium]
MISFTALKVVVLAAWAGVLAVAERMRPATARPAASGRIAGNLALWLANTAMNPVLTAPIVLAATQIDAWARPAAWSGPGALVVDLLILDLWAYAWHRANHRWPLLWRFHEVHHRDAFLDVTTAVRFHPGEVLISALARAPLIVALDTPLMSVLFFDALLFAAALFHHSNLRLPPRTEATLRWFIATPSHHWVHHHARRSDTDSNYGVLLTAWDRLFASWSPTLRTPTMPIGVEGEPALPPAALAWRPFHRGSIRAA